MHPPRPCNDCGAVPGELHVLGCAQERCALCGGQCIACDCVYELQGVRWYEREEEPDEEMFAVLDAAVEARGGRLPWQGEFPGSAACRAFGFWSRWVNGRGWVSCERETEGAGEDLNRLCVETRWDAEARGWVRNSDGLRWPWTPLGSEPSSS
jgi:hypothetical protein